MGMKYYVCISMRMDAHMYVPAHTHTHTHVHAHAHAHAHTHTQTGSELIVKQWTKYCEIRGRVLAV